MKAVLIFKRPGLACLFIIASYLAHAAESPGDYMVFFNIDEKTVTYEGREVIQAAANMALRHLDYRVEVIGHDDSVLPELQSLILSLERARETARLLVEMGVPANRILFGGVGSKDPFVPTAEGVSEAQNRFVGIQFAPIAERKTKDYLQPFK